ncbi:hypothetical protein B0H67DRAFT_602227 [Lasiosphaeris hirsuta]|uniref:ubiquitinyl hydrolase 1 n=1 Tax=Lasiosphaeris hirsuta TaxID=260670 RepID=A0AA40A8Y2_9PEZI|nr:hypothetical protein B0H67DRAFT_602227 [Lasiosphaeris hirsuta]
MDPEQENTGSKEDVDMITAPATEPQEQETSQGTDTTQEAMASVEEADTELPLRTDIPPLDQQVKTIETLVKAFAESQPAEGNEAYLVSRQWLSRAQAFGADAKQASKELPRGSLGPVDNGDIMQAIFTDANGQRCVKLKPGTGIENFELFPEEAWSLLLTWYGLADGQIPIVRTAHNTSPDPNSLPNIQFEFHPPVFTVHRLWSAITENPPPPVIVQSTSYGFHNFMKQVKEHTGVQKDRKVRLWRVLQTIPTTVATTETSAQPSGIKTPPDSPGRVSDIFTVPTSPGAWPEMLVDVESFLKLEKDVDRALVEGEDTTLNLNYNGRRSLSLVGLTVDQILVVDEFVDRDNNVSTFRGGNLNNALATRGSSGSLAAQTRANASGRSSPALLGPVTRGRAQQKSGRSVGCVGLQNLGNTCYMNSALQCVRSVEELTKYFLTREAHKEINPDNPLSHNGEVALAYGRLLEEIYKEPVPNSIQPRHFKSIIGRYAPAFSGFGQQDSQEFLGFLLDGLQEDLNRIKKKPYIEKPDSTDEMINNPAAIRELANKVWDITKKRDDSVIADLFTGLYKSTLVCPTCDKVSITFDPFNNLTLPLPVANVWTRAVKYFPLNEPPVEIVVDIDKNSSMRTLKQYISARVGVPAERLFGAEEFRDKFFKFYDDMSSVSEEIQPNDNPTIHELEGSPTNMASVKKLKKQRYRSLLDDTEAEDVASWEDPMAERLLVPVVHRLNPEDPAIRKHRYARNKNAAGDIPPPHFVLLTPQEARNEDIIRRKILERLASYSTWSAFTAADDTDTAETDPEMVNNTSDVDSAGDAKIVAKSVEGEEDIVDVTMSDVADTRKSATPAATEQYPLLLKQFNQQRPKWINPAEFLDPQFQNLFELSYFQEQGTSIPTGWQTIQDENVLPRLSTRQPKPATSDVEMRSPGAWEGSDESGSEESPRAQPSNTRMVDESSDDEDFAKQIMVLTPCQNIAQRPNGSSHKNQTYGKKGKKRLEKQQQQRNARAQFVGDSEDAGTSDNGPLVRLGEGIVVEWSEDAFDYVFGGTSPNDTRGMRTYAAVPTLEDPAIETKKKQRQLRRKNGITLDDCLDEFEKEEILSEQDTWYCPRCKEHRRASKKFDLWKTPDILVVHLKRFSSSGWRRDKLDILVDFPVEGLDLTTRVINKEDGKQEVYDLIAVDNHWGGLGGGHYTAFARNFVDDEWYEYNDTSVSKQKDPSKVISTGAYLLFYRRRSDIPLGGPKFINIFDRFNSQHAADEDMTSDSGEGQRLGLGSSLRGSPSALTGADLTLPQGNRGLASDLSDTIGRAGRAISVDAELPTYQASLTQVGEVDDDNDIGAGINWSQQGTLRNSIEADGEDEGIDLPSYENAGMAGMTSVIGGTSWSFDALAKVGSEVGADDDIASDIAQGGSSSINGVFADPTDEMEPMLLNEPSSGYVERPGEPGEDYASFDSLPGPSPEQDYDGRLAVESWGQQVVHKVPADVSDDQASDKVAEIHVSDEHVLPEEPWQNPDV